MEYIKFIFENAKDGAAWGLFAFSMIINLILCLVIRTLYNSSLEREKDMREVIADVKTVLSTNNTLIQLWLSGVKKR